MSNEVAPKFKVDDRVTIGKHPDVARVLRLIADADGVDYYRVLISDGSERIVPETDMQSCSSITLDEAQSRMCELLLELEESGCEVRADGENTLWLFGDEGSAYVRLLGKSPGSALPPAPSR